MLVTVVKGNKYAGLHRALAWSVMEISVYSLVQMFWFNSISFNVGPKYSLFYFHVRSWDLSKVVEAKMVQRIQASVGFGRH